MNRAKFLLLFTIAQLIFIMFMIISLGTGVFAAEPSNAEAPIQEVLELEEEEPKQEVVIEENTPQEEEQPKEQAEPTTTTITTTTTEEELISDADKEKINQFVDFISKLNKDELLDLLNQAKNWFIGIGIVGALSILTCIISLVAAIVKLHNEKIRNSQLTEQAKKEAIESANNFEKKLDERTQELKMLLLEFVNGLSDEDKKQVESNTESVKTMLFEILNKDKKED